MVDVDALEVWATFVAEALQEVIDEAVEAEPDTPEEEVCADLRMLLKDLDRILLGGGSLMTELLQVPVDPDIKLNI